MALCPFAIQLGPIPASNYSTQAGPKIGVAIHDIEGTAASAVSEFERDGAQLSATMVIAGPTMQVGGQTYIDGWPDGTLLQILDSGACPYAQEDGNYPPTGYAAIEVAGFTSIPMSDAQMVTLAKAVSWLAKDQGFPLVGPVPHGTPGVTTHCNPDGTPDPNWGDHPCPGLLRLAQVPDVVAMAISGNHPQPQPQEALMPVSIPIFFANNYHELQVHGGTLWHKWWVFGQKDNGNENVLTATGLPAAAASFPDQYPQVAIVNNQLGVCVEDSTGRAWFFSQSAGAAWGAKAQA